MPNSDKVAQAQRAIGMFDSGLGGLTVMRALSDHLPNEHIIYLGDTARLPYGQKSPETITRYSVENAIFLMEQEIKLLVVACNTASAYSIDRLQRIFTIPIVGVITPGAAYAAQISKTGRIAVLGTKGTIASGAYQAEIAKMRPDAHIIPLACPLLVPLVEEGYFDHPASLLLLEEYLEPALKGNVDTLLLGCTHYPLLRAPIEKIMGPSVSIIDSASTCAKTVAAILEKHSLKTNNSLPAEASFFVSDDAVKFATLGERFLGKPLNVAYQCKLPLV